jgi:hypothetical protein
LKRCGRRSLCEHIRWHFFTHDRRRAFPIGRDGVPGRGNRRGVPALSREPQPIPQEDIMGLGKGALLWLIGIPLPIILLLAFFWH